MNKSYYYLAMGIITLFYILVGIYYINGANKFHWYCLSYYGGNDTQEIRTSKYVGFKNKHITKNTIEKYRPKESTKESALISCSYLGFMTEVKFRNSKGGTRCQ